MAETKGKRILLIEDEPGLIVTLTDRLTAEGYLVETATDGLKGEKAGREGGHDLIVLDVMLPHKGGFDVCRDLRHGWITTPILILTARGEVTEKVVGLKLGAADYLPKPFDMLALLARLEVLLRRRGQPAGGSPRMETFCFGKNDVDFRSMEVSCKGVRVDLSAREFQLLRYFIEHRGEVLSREMILNGVWGYDAMPTTRTIDTHVTWLRQKLEENHHHPEHILTIYGVGYRFVG